MDRECHRFYEALTAGESASVFHRNWSVRLYLHHSCISCPWEYLFFFVFVRLREKVCVDAESVITGRERDMDRVIMDKGCCVCGWVSVMNPVQAVVPVVCVTTLPWHWFVYSERGKLCDHAITTTTLFIPEVISCKWNLPFAPLFISNKTLMCLEIKYYAVNFLSHYIYVLLSPPMTRQQIIYKKKTKQKYSPWGFSLCTANVI